MSLLNRGGSAGLLTAGLLTGCSPDITSYATLTADSASALIDVNCDTESCAGDAEGFSLALEEHLAWGVDGVAEFLQYRVDYALDSGTLDFFAAETAISVTTGTTETFTLALAGASQRSAIAQLTDSSVSGEATITLAGYDPLNATVQVSTTIPIEFEDVIGATDTSTGDTGLSGF